jgi:hypothetical protein
MGRSPHRATPEFWDQLQQLTDSLVLELRSRAEALEGEVVVDQPDPPTVATDLLDAKAWAYIGRQAACGDSEAQFLIDLLNQSPTPQPAQPAPATELEGVDG